MLQRGDQRSGLESVFPGIVSIVCLGHGSCLQGPQLHAFAESSQQTFKIGRLGLAAHPLSLFSSVFLQAGVGKLVHNTPYSGRHDLGLRLSPASE
jgi:hypothetical protein